LRLPGVAMSNDRKVANGFSSVGFHKSESVLSEIKLPFHSSDRHPATFISNEKRMWLRI